MNREDIEALSTKKECLAYAEEHNIEVDKRKGYGKLKDQLLSYVEAGEPSLEDNLMASLSEQSSVDYSAPIEGCKGITIVKQGQSTAISEESLEKWCKENGVPFDAAKSALGRPWTHCQGYVFHLDKQEET